MENARLCSTRRWLCRVAAAAWLGAALPALQAAPNKPAPHKPEPVQGVVTQVFDGGSVRLTPPGQAAFDVRVRDIEPIEPCQPGAAEAKAALSSFVLNKTATLVRSGRDRQGRVIGALLVDDVNIGRRMVEEGWAWSVRTRNDVGPFVKQERMAKALVRGVHAQVGALSPRDWRKTRGACPSVPR